MKPLRIALTKGRLEKKTVELFEKLRTESDVNSRIEIIKQIEQILMDDSVAIYFCYPLMNFVTKAEVTGVTSHTSDYYWVSKDTGFTD